MLNLVRTLHNQQNALASSTTDHPDNSHPLHLGQITSIDMIRLLKEQLQKWYGDFDSFPGSIPLSLMRKNIASMYNGTEQYIVTYKSDGVRCILFLTICFEQKICVWIDRGGRFY